MKTRYLILASLWFCIPHAPARLHFADQTASIALQPGYTQVKIKHNNTVSGWDQQSIIPADKNNTWTADDSMIGYGPQFSQKPTTQFIYNNSNAIAYQEDLVGTALNHNTPTTFDNRMRWNSNAIHYYAPIIRNNSHAIRISSNALRYGIRNNSNALISILENASINFGTLTIGRATYKLPFDWFVSLDTKISITSDCIINGDGHFIYFAQNSPSCFNIALGKTVTFSNVALKNFTDDVFEIETAAKTVFGYGTTIELSPDNAYTSLNRNWIFSGQNMLVYGTGNTLDLNTKSVNVTGTLTLANITLDNLNKSILTGNTSRSNIILRDSTLNLSGAYSFTMGALEIQKDVLISGTNIFSYKTNRQLKINKNSALIIDAGTGFKYDPTNTNKDLIYLLDKTSIMYMNGCQISGTYTYMRLTKGTLVIDGANDVVPFNTSRALTLALGNSKKADDITLIQQPGALLSGPAGSIRDDRVVK